MRPIGIFGGTFDPIHYGHLRSAYELLQDLRLAEVRFVPNAVPPHRGRTRASAELRLRMVEIAVAGQQGFTVDARELHREGPSYTVDTLTAIRAEHARESLCLIIGSDAWAGLTTWRRWDEILELAHIIIAHRPGWELSRGGQLGELHRAKGVTDAEELHRQRCGKIYHHAVTQLEIASTDIRDLVAAGKDPRFLMPEGVRDLILESKCYAKEEE